MTFPAGGYTPEELAAALDWLPHLQEADLMELRVSNDTVDGLMQQKPELRFLWMVNVANMRVRSDLQCFSTQFDVGKPRYSNRELAPLFQYCTELRALDVGHNDLTDLEPISRLSHLRVLIIGDNLIADISPLAELKELEYLEMFMFNQTTDFSALAGLHQMVDLNMGYCQFLDCLDFLDEMPELKMAWFPNAPQPIPESERERAQREHPDAVFIFANERRTSTGNGWRASERNVAIRCAFKNWYKVESYNGWDDITYREGSIVIPVGPQYNN